MGSGQVMHMVGKSVTKLFFNISLIINQRVTRSSKLLLEISVSFKMLYHYEIDN